jgi:toxin HigB-1
VKLSKAERRAIRQAERAVRPDPLRTATPPTCTGPIAPVDRFAGAKVAAPSTADSAIGSFADPQTEAIYHSGAAPGPVLKKARKQLPEQLWGIARRKLDMLAAAHSPLDLGASKGNNLERLHGKLAGHWSIRINDQYRIVFQFDQATRTFQQVRAYDYHDAI